MQLASSPLLPFPSHQSNSQNYRIVEGLGLEGTSEITQLAPSSTPAACFALLGFPCPGLCPGAQDDAEPAPL